MSGGNKSRREFMKIAAGVAGAVVLTGAAKKLIAATVEKPSGGVERMDQELWDALKKAPSRRKWMMGVDTRKCIGCDSCSVACAVENVAPGGTSYRPVSKTAS